MDKEPAPADSSRRCARGRRRSRWPCARRCSPCSSRAQARRPSGRRCRAGPRHRPSPGYRGSAALRPGPGYRSCRAASAAGARSAPRPGCGYVNVGNRQIPVDCLTPGYGEIASAARALIPGSALRLSPAHAGAAELPAKVDHREDGTRGPVRQQGDVGACSGFSFTAAIDHALARKTGQPGHVS